MTLTFPVSPTIGQIHYDGAKYWYWTGIAWRVNNLVLNSPPDILRVDGQSASNTTAFVVANPSLPSVVEDTKGDVRTLVINNQVSGYTLTTSDNGKIVSIASGGITLPANQFSEGQNITIFNNSAASQTITATGVTCYFAGVGATGNRTLSGYGLATIVCINSNIFVISGAGLS